MQTDPDTGQVGNRERVKPLTWFTDPDSYRALLKRWPTVRVCLAHFGGAGDWERYLDDPWDSTSDPAEKSWLAKIADMIRSGLARPSNPRDGQTRRVWALTSRSNVQALRNVSAPRVLAVTELDGTPHARELSTRKSAVSPDAGGR